MGRIFYWVMFVGFAAANLMMVAPQLMSTSEETVRIAVVGPMSGPDADDGRDLVDGVRILVERLEQSGDLGARRIDLDIRDDANSPETAVQVARDLADESGVIAVIGHTTDATAQAAAEVYREAGLPAVTGSSGLRDIAGGNDWFFRTGLSTFHQGTFLVNFVAHVMGEKGVHIISTEDSYGEAVFVAMEDEMSYMFRQGVARVETLNHWTFDPADPDMVARLDEIVQELSASYAREPVLLAVSESVAATVLQKLGDNQRTRFGKPIPFTLIGPDALGQPDVLASLASLRRESLQPGFYTNGMHVVAPFLEDVSNHQALEFRQSYRDRFGRDANVVAAGAFDAGIAVVDAVKRMIADPNDTEAARTAVRDGLAKIDRTDTAITGVTGSLHFDQDGNANTSVPIGVFKDRRLVSPPTQLSSVLSIKSASDRTVYQITGQYFTPTQIVYTGVRVNAIEDIDFVERSATIDFNVWFRFKGDFDPASIHFANALEPIDLGEAVKVTEATSEGGDRYRQYRVNGRFHNGFIQAESPRAGDVLGFQLRHATDHRERLIFVPDLVGMEQGQTEGFTERVRRKTNFGEEADLQVARASIFLDNEPVAVMGDPELSGRKIEGFSRLNLAVWAAPTDVSIVALIDPDVAVTLFISFGLILGLLGILQQRLADRFWYKWFWFPQSFVAIGLLVTGLPALAAVFTTMIPNAYMVEISGLVMRILWWIGPALLAVGFVERFVWMPLEERTGRQIPRVVRVFFAGTILTLGALAVTAFVFDQKVTSLLATSGVLAMIIGLAIQMNLSNIFSGIAINIERPFRMGDWIRVSDFEPGRVVSITWRTTRLETIDRNIICIPNSVASDSSLENLSYPTDEFRSELMVHVDPGAKPAWVEKILMDAVMASSEVLTAPEPQVLFLGVKEWSATYAVRFFCEDYRASIALEAAVWRDIIRNLKYAGFESVIHQEFTLFHLTEAARENRDLAPKLLDDVEVFEPFGASEKTALCQTMARRRFEPDRIVIQQGDPGDSLFIVAEGALKVEIELDDSDDVLEVGRLGSGDFFGEMALLTGEERGATVTTLTPSLVFEIAKRDIEPIVAAYPDIQQDLSQILTRRTLENLRRKNAHSASLDEERSLASRMLSRITSFFDATTMTPRGERSAAE